MALSLSAISRSCKNVRILEEKLRQLSISYEFKRDRHLPSKPRLRHPVWLTRKNVTSVGDPITPENTEFIREVVQDERTKHREWAKSIIPETTEWNPKIQRTGVIARKIGVYPLWLKNGEKITTTLLQVLDNHVVRYYTPEQYTPVKQLRPRAFNNKGCLLIGAEIGDPTNFTKDYCGLFKQSGVLPTKWLGRFFITPDAALPLGTTLSVRHFQVGNYVDVRGKTIDRGFQGVMKRHGFKGMPASHGVTKTHRRGGNIGGGGEKGRVWPGTKMPGHMGNRYRIARGLKIWRINTKYNVLWVSGQAIPGETNSLVNIYDTKLILRRPKNVPVPTYVEGEEDLVEDIYDESVQQFSDPTILYNEK